jgi:hypothetical protein
MMESDLMALFEVHARDGIEFEPRSYWPDNVAICGSLLAGMFLGQYVGKSLGGHAVGWLGMGIGGAFLGGFGYYVICVFRPHLGHPLAAVRIVVLLLLVGAFCYFAEWWMGRFGPLVLVLIPILVNALVCVVKAMKVAIGVLHAWYRLKKHHP